jgi:hypothetical protein
MIIRPNNPYKGRRHPNGRHQGQLIETVIIKSPDYIRWLSEQLPHPGFQWLYDYIRECIDVFDGKPFVATCAGKIGTERCGNPATRFTMYPNSVSLYFWCDICDPEQLGAVGKLTEGTCYYEALAHVAHTCEGRRAGYRSIIKSIAKAKGLPKRVEEQQMIEFFYGPEARVKTSDD